MSRKPEWRFRLTFRHTLLSGFVWIGLGGELVVKPLVRKVRKHLSLFTSEGKLYRHVTHEEHALDGRRRYTQKAEIPPEKLLNPILRGLSPAEDAPPRITSFAEQEQNVGSSGVVRAYLAAPRPENDENLQALGFNGFLRTLGRKGHSLN